MEETKDIFTEILKKNGSSLTQPRRIVFDALLGQEPLSMHDLYQKVQGKLDRVSLYRIMRLFEQLSIVQRIYVGWKYKVELSDIFTYHHHHISCISCHKLISIHEDQEIEELITKLARTYAVIPTSHQLEVQGYCHDCQLKQSSISS